MLTSQPLVYRPRAMGTEEERLRALGDAMARDLDGNVLPFWVREAVDEEHGGFHGFLSEDGVPGAARPEGRRPLRPHPLDLLRRARARGGPGPPPDGRPRASTSSPGASGTPSTAGPTGCWTARGRPLEGRKQTYALAFSLYGLVEYHRATGSVEALERAIELHRAIEAHAADPEHGGYAEARARDWGPLADVRLSDKDLNAPKSMNTHLHVMEAYASLLRAWDDPGLRERVRALVALHLDRILDPATGHLLLFFDERWAPLSRTVSVRPRHRGELAARGGGRGRRATPRSWSGRRRRRCGWRA